MALLPCTPLPGNVERPPFRPNGSERSDVHLERRAPLIRSCASHTMLVTPDHELLSAAQTLEATPRQNP